MLEKILSHKREEVAAAKGDLPLAELRRRAADMSPPRDFPRALRGERVAVIAEIKRASPSKGLLAPHLDPAATARRYEEGGASAISVLTDQRFFAGSLADLAQARAAVGLPLLRKDFVIDEYQVYESRAAGADAILLIVAGLADGQLGDLLGAARELGLACLVETHDEGELRRALACGARLVGVNSRDLRTFTVDLGTVERLAGLVPSDRTLVAESGIGGRADVERLAAAGVDAVLVGETVVKADDPATLLRDLASVSSLGRRRAAQGAVP
jgi:indole-3-glycerol phosphate synthase